MPSRLRIDIETFSSVDLTKTGVYRYSESPDFLILMVAWSLDGGPVQVALTREEIWEIPGLWDSSVIKVAHNAQFERVCFSAFAGLPVGEYLPPEEWHDTQAVAAEHGYPQKLENLAPALGAEPKDSAGTRLTNIFCKPNRKGARTLPEEKPLEWLDFIDYCVQDVVSLIGVDEALEELGGWPTEMEWEVFLADQKVNDLGIRIDPEMAIAAVAAASKNEARQMFELSELTGWEVLNANSQPQMMAWVRAQGLPATNLQADTVTRLLDGDLTDDQRGVFELRQELALVAAKKFGSALRAVSPDNRLRGTLKFFGAHTGRWSGRGTQVQNLPREQLDSELLVDSAILDLKLGEDVDANTLKALVRALFVGPLTVVDYASIEAIVIAWWAGESWPLEAFLAGRDLYVEAADRMNEATGQSLGRSQGKVAVLALNYNGAVNSLRAMGAEGTTQELMVLVKGYRQSIPNIVGKWQELGDAFAEPGPVGEFLRVTDSHNSMGRSVHIHLPSGRALNYHNVKWERYRIPDPLRPGKWIDKEGWRYASPKAPFNKNLRIGTYGGRLAENVTQAIARDIWAEGLVRLQRAGYDVVGHVHDEGIVEGAHDVEAIKKLMIEPPAWATGLPIGGAGGIVQRYRKL